MTYSFNAFFNEVKAMAKQVGNDDYRVEVCRNSEGEYWFYVYISNVGYMSGSSPEACIALLQHAIRKIKVEDVIIETP